MQREKDESKYLHEIHVFINLVFEINALYVLYGLEFDAKFYMLMLIRLCFFFF